MRGVKRGANSPFYNRKGPPACVEQAAVDERDSCCAKQVNCNTTATDDHDQPSSPPLCKGHSRTYTATNPWYSPNPPHTTRQRDGNLPIHPHLLSSVYVDYYRAQKPRTSSASSGARTSTFFRPECMHATHVIKRPSVFDQLVRHLCPLMQYTIL